MTEIQNTETGMVERLSRVLCVCRGNNPNRRLEEYGQTSHSYWAWELYVDEVKALMKAMREPTGAMKEAGAVSFQMEDIDEMFVQAEVSAKARVALGKTLRSDARGITINGYYFIEWPRISTAEQLAGWL